MEAPLLYLALTGGVAICIWLGARSAKPLLPWAAAVLVWTFFNPLLAGPPTILKSVERGPYYHDVLIPWASTTVTRPPRIVRAQTRDEVIRAVTEATHVRPVGSAHSYANLFGTSGTSLYLDYCTARWSGNIVVADGGCKIYEIREQARAKGKVVRGLGAIYQQTVAGGVATSLHGDERLRFVDYVHNVTVVNAQGGVETLQPDEIDGSQGTRGVILSVTIECEDNFDVRRTEQLTDIEETLHTVERVRLGELEAGGGQCVVQQGADGCQWLTWEMQDAGTAGRSLPAEKQRPKNGVAWTFMVDNVLLPMTLLFPWLAPVGIATSPFVYDTDDDGIIEFALAQGHAPVNMLPTGEIDTARCREVTEGLIELAKPYGPLSLVLRPSERGCWVDYAVIPWAPGSLGRFYDDVARRFSNETFHRGKIGTEYATAAPKFAIQLAPDNTLDAERVAWIALIVATFATAAAVGVASEDEGYSRV
jgi:hypothetical protein